MIHAHIAGVVHDQSRERVGEDGRTRARMYLSVADGSGRPQYCICTATNAELRAAMLRVKPGDAVSVTGHCTVTLHPKGNGGDRAVTLHLAVTALLAHQSDFDNLDEMENDHA